MWAFLSLFKNLYAYLYISNILPMSRQTESMTATELSYISVSSHDIVSQLKKYSKLIMKFSALSNWE
jgi:hypothetical protein